MWIQKSLFMFQKQGQFYVSEAGTESSLTFMKVWVQRRDFKYNIALFPLSRWPTWQTIFKQSAVPQPCI